MCHKGWVYVHEPQVATGTVQDRVVRLWITDL